MKTDLTEDFEDLQNIEKQKEEQNNGKEKMDEWEFVTGVKEKGDKKRGI